MYFLSLYVKSRARRGERPARDTFFSVIQPTIHIKHECERAHARSRRRRPRRARVNAHPSYKAYTIPITHTHSRRVMHTKQSLIHYAVNDLLKVHHGTIKRESCILHTQPSINITYRRALTRARPGARVDNASSLLRTTHSRCVHRSRLSRLSRLSRRRASPVIVSPTHGAVNARAATSRRRVRCRRFVPSRDPSAAPRHLVRANVDRARARGDGRRARRRGIYRGICWLSFTREIRARERSCGRRKARVDSIFDREVLGTRVMFFGGEELND